MSSRIDPLRRVASIALCAALATAPGAISDATTGATIVVWKIGSPHRGDIPDVSVSPAFTRESARRGVRIAVAAVSARAFASTFFDAVTRNAAPDVIVLDNMGLINGITVGREKFDGIAQEPTVRRDLIRVTGAFDALLGPAREWTYLFSSSPNHSTARALALSAPECPNGLVGPELESDLAEIVPKLAGAYLERDAVDLQAHSDPDRLHTGGSTQETGSVGGVRPCGMWGNRRLAFAHVSVSYEADKAIGHTPVLMVLRKPSFQWQLLVAARDPISTGAFVKQLPSVTALLTKEQNASAFPLPPTLLSPADGHFPLPSDSQRFGMFRWRPSPSDDVVGEIVEFAYQNDARLFFRRSARGASHEGISAGELWTTRGIWNWRVWSISRTGDVVLSDARTFVH
jgi:hypothetical protein